MSLVTRLRMTAVKALIDTKLKEISDSFLTRHLFNTKLWSLFGVCTDEVL